MANTNQNPKLGRRTRIHCLNYNNHSNKSSYPNMKWTLFVGYCCCCFWLYLNCFCILLINCDDHHNIVVEDNKVRSESNDGTTIRSNDGSQSNGESDRLPNLDEDSFKRENQIFPNLLQQRDKQNRHKHRHQLNRRRLKKFLRKQQQQKRSKLKQFYNQSNNITIKRRNNLDSGTTSVKQRSSQPKLQSSSSSSFSSKSKFGASKLEIELLSFNDTEPSTDSSHTFRSFETTPAWTLQSYHAHQPAAAAAGGNHHRHQHSHYHTQSRQLRQFTKQTKQQQQQYKEKLRPEKKKTAQKPNIIFILTDDQDIELGSMNYMPKTMQIMAEGGVYVKNAYATTPMCCPSRSSILTGLYVHNHNVYTNGENCSSPQWQQTHERRTFATYLNQAGYRTAYFGKYLNEYNGSYIPPGWSDWSGLVRNSRYYNYTLNVNGDKVRHGFDYAQDYYPDLILNDSLQYLRYSKRFFSSKPYLMVLSFPSPHGPEDSAPQYQNMFLQERRHRTISWNYAPNGDKQWLLRNTPKMSTIHQEFTDFLNAKRLQTLQTVDEAVAQLYRELDQLGQLDNTYLIYTSDHGYHLGQFGLVKGKAMPFEFDIRVPFFIRGPNVPAGQILPQIMLNIDIAPTLLDIAGLKIPSHMDGISVMPYIGQLASNNNDEPELTHKSKQQVIRQRDSFLIERGKFKTFNSVDRLLMPIFGKKQWLQMQCLKPEYQSPCRPRSRQRFECYQNEFGEQRIRKCPPPPPPPSTITVRSERDKNGQCICPPRAYHGKKIVPIGGGKRGDKSSKRFRNKHRLLRKMYAKRKNWPNKQHNINPQSLLEHRNIHGHRRRRRNRGGYRNRRSHNNNNHDDELPLLLPFQDESYIDFDVQGVYELKKLIEISKSSSLASNNSKNYNDNDQSIRSNDSNDGDRLSGGSSANHHNSDNNNNNLANITTSQLVSILNQSEREETMADFANYTDYLNRTFCTVTRSNLSIECSAEIYSNQDEWREKKNYINSAIMELQRRLFELKEVRRFINENRPVVRSTTWNNHQQNDQRINLSLNKGNQTTMLINDQENECSCQLSSQMVDEYHDDVDHGGDHLITDNINLFNHFGKHDDDDDDDVDVDDDGDGDDQNQNHNDQHRPPNHRDQATDRNMRLRKKMANKDDSRRNNVSDLYRRDGRIHTNDDHDDHSVGFGGGVGGGYGRLRSKSFMYNDNHLDNDTTFQTSNLEGGSNNLLLLRSSSSSLPSSMQSPKWKQRQRQQTSLSSTWPHRKNLKRWLRRKERKLRRRGRFENTSCEQAAQEHSMNCFTHDNDHWKTPPLWTNGPFCFCQNSLNSSFWCLRTINETNNTLYCEFVTGFISYYDLNKDPYQLRNLIFDLEFNMIEELSKRLARLKTCSGSLNCSITGTITNNNNDQHREKKIHQ